MTDPKQQVQECRVGMFSMQNDPALQLVLRITTLELHQLDQRLRRCTSEELSNLQGQVAVWERLRKYITTDPAVAT